MHTNLRSPCLVWLNAKNSWEQHCQCGRPRIYSSMNDVKWVIIRILPRSPLAETHMCMGALSDLRIWFSERNRQWSWVFPCRSRLSNIVTLYLTLYWVSRVNRKFLIFQHPALTLSPITSSISFCNFLCTSGLLTSSRQHRRSWATVVSKPSKWVID